MDSTDRYPPKELEINSFYPFIVFIIQVAPIMQYSRDQFRANFKVITLIWSPTHQLTKIFVCVMMFTPEADKKPKKSYQNHPIRANTFKLSSLNTKWITYSNGKVR